MIVSSLLRKIEQNRGSTHFAWKALIFLKDMFWIIKEFLCNAFKALWTAPVKIYDLISIRYTIRHVWGPDKIDYALNELVVISLVRNGSFFMEAFINHYQSMGVKHIVFLDNGSNDNTIEIIKQFNNVTVLRTDIIIGDKIYLETYLRQYLAYRFCRKRWCLWVDMDEFFDYPCSDRMNLERFLEYLNVHSYTAVITQMLDMFSDKPLSQSCNGSFKDTHCYYDLSDILKYDYKKCRYANKSPKNVVVNDRIKFHMGGVRKSVFGLMNPLTKHQLFLVDGIHLIDPHWVVNAKCADFSAVCLHYKFTGNFLGTLVEYVRDNFSTIGKDYAAILSKVTVYPELTLKLGTAMELKSLSDLIEHEFLVVSAQYQKWVKANS